jgi:hypothetical protein
LHIGRRLSMRDGRLHLEIVFEAAGANRFDDAVVDPAGDAHDQRLREVLAHPAKHPPHGRVVSAGHECAEMIDRECFVGFDAIVGKVFWVKSVRQDLVSSGQNFVEIILHQSANTDDRIGFR